MYQLKNKFIEKSNQQSKPGRLKGNVFRCSMHVQREGKWKLPNSNTISPSNQQLTVRLETYAQFHPENKNYRNAN